MKCNGAHSFWSMRTCQDFGSASSLGTSTPGQGWLTARRQKPHAQPFMAAPQGRGQARAVSQVALGNSFIGGRKINSHTRLKL